ncbi:hypothetical protein ACFCQI_01795 [Rhodanobacter sp. FW102-FHT14D06]|uniref:DUF1351 domain-containing protein n=2 Tax=unclassified Rhodanobacter TaxID=2621553 RepID=A0AB74UUX9_9GAMM
MDTTEKTAGSNLTQIAEYSETAAALADLRQRHQGVVYDVAKPKEMKAAKEARAELRTLRTSLEKTRKEIKAPALERCRLIDDEAKRITAELVALEEPIDVQIKAEEARAEAERLAKLEAERLRVEAIQKKIQAIRDVPASLVGKPSVIIAGQLAKLRETTLDEAELGADYLTATDALTAAVARVQDLLAAQQEADAEKKRQAERDAEMEAMRVKMAEQQRLIDEAEAERVERERKAAAEEAGRIAREAAEKRQREIEAQAELDRVARAEREEADRIEREEQDRIRAEQAEADRIQREQDEAVLHAERERQAAEQRKLDEQAAQLKREREAAAKKAEADRLANLGLREAAQAVVDYEVTDATPIGGLWNLIDDLRVALSNDENRTAKAVTVNRTKREARV